MNQNAPKFTWNQESVDNQVHDAANEIRIVRPLLKLYGKQGAYTTNIFGHHIKGRQQDKHKRRCAKCRVGISAGKMPLKAMAWRRACGEGGTLRT